MIKAYIYEAVKC